MLQIIKVLRSSFLIASTTVCLIACGTKYIVQPEINSAPLSTVTPLNTNTPTPTLTPTRTPQPTSTPNGGGEQIAFRTIPVGAKSAHISMMNSDGSNARQFLDMRWLRELTWSPDGRRLAFAHDYGSTGGGELYVVDADGSNQRQIVEYFYSSHIAWSPNSHEIAFVFGDKIYVIDLMENVTRQITDEDAVGRVPSWSPDGGRIAFLQKGDDGYEIHMMNLNSTNTQKLVDTDSWCNNSLSWSPSGEQIATVSCPDGPDGSWEIDVVDVNNNIVHNIRNLEAYDGPPIWSPDGKQILFGSERDGNQEIYIVDADGENLRNLTNHEANDGHNGYSIDWSPDGTQIVFSSDREDNNMEIYIMNVDGSNVRRLTYSESEYDYTPRWQPNQNN